MTISRIDAPTMRMLRDEIHQAVQGVARRYGLAISLHGEACEQTTDTLMLRVAPPAGGSSNAPDRASFARYAAHYGLDPDDFDAKDVLFAGTWYTLIGLGPAGHKFPILGRTDSGKTYWLPIQALNGATLRKL